MSLRSSAPISPVNDATRVGTPLATEPKRHRDPPVDSSHRAAVQAIASELDAYLQQHQQSVRFQVDARTGLVVAHIYNDATGEAVKQIPNEVNLRIAQFLRATNAGSDTLIDATA